MLAGTIPITAIGWYAALTLTALISDGARSVDSGPYTLVPASYCHSLSHSSHLTTSSPTATMSNPRQRTAAALRGRNRRNRAPENSGQPPVARDPQTAEIGCPRCGNPSGALVQRPALACMAGHITAIDIALTAFPNIMGLPTAPFPGAFCIAATRFVGRGVSRLTGEELDVCPCLELSEEAVEEPSEPSGGGSGQL